MRVLFFSNYYKIMDANWYFMYDILIFFSNTQASNIVKANYNIIM